MNNLLHSVKDIDINDYDYQLEDNRIAKFPVEPRDISKLLVYKSGKISDTIFKNLPSFLEKGSLLVYNNTKVIHARIIFHKSSGARIELFCLEPLNPADYAQNFQSTNHCDWLCLVGNLKKWKSGILDRELDINGQKIIFKAEKLESINNAHRIRFSWSKLETGQQSSPNAGKKEIRFCDLLESAGKIPIPPYLNRDSVESDETDYQTVYSKIEGSVAAPTAGLHFTDEVLENLDKKGVIRREVTLHVGAGTFKPVSTDQLAQHSMHSEFISVNKELIQELIEYEGHVTAVGTTSVRTLESLYWFGCMLLKDPGIRPEEWNLDQWYSYEIDGSGFKPATKDALEALIKYMEASGINVFTASTRLLIAPGYKYRVVNELITNFHQPKSTLLLLVSAFLGEDNWKNIYRYALDNDFRFLSYGDSSLLIP